MENYERTIRDFCLKGQQYRCWYCGVLLDDKTANIDHQTPKSKGGDNRMENLVVACRHCNSQKKNKTVEEYRSYLQEKSRVIGFSKEQKQYPESIGMPLPEAPKVIFWYEKSELPY